MPSMLLVDLLKPLVLMHSLMPAVSSKKLVPLMLPFLMDSLDTGTVLLILTLNLVLLLEEVLTLLKLHLLPLKLLPLPNLVLQTLTN